MTFKQYLIKELFISAKPIWNGVVINLPTGNMLKILNKNVREWFDIPRVSLSNIRIMTILNEAAPKRVKENNCGIYLAFTREYSGWIGKFIDYDMNVIPED